MAPSPRAQRRRIIGFAVHVVVFAAVVLLSRGRIPGPGAAMWWAFGLGMHGVVALLPLVLGQLALRGGDEAGGQAAGPILRPARGVARGFWAEAGQLIDALEQQRRDGGLHPRLDFTGLREAVLDLHHRAEGLAGLGDEADLLQLGLQQDEAAERARTAGDETSAEAFEQEALAIAHRKSSLEAAIRTRVRLMARQRTLLHQLQSLRASGAHALAGAAQGAEDELNEEAEQLLEELRANREVEEELARGRRSASRARRAPEGS
ncbi:MAG: hypothetical protein RL071_400 [Pseudomonadota bacterium]|jgi:hypothetical protein